MFHSKIRTQSKVEKTVPPVKFWILLWNMFSSTLFLQIYDNAMITAGLNDDPRPMISRLNDLLTKALEKHWQLLHHELWGLMFSSLGHAGSSWQRRCGERWATGLHLSLWRLIEAWKLRMRLVFIRYRSHCSHIFRNFSKCRICIIDFANMSASAHTPSERFGHANTSFFKEHLIRFRGNGHL